MYKNILCFLENQPPSRSPKKTVKLDSKAQIIPTTDTGSVAVDSKTRVIPSASSHHVDSRTRVITAYSPDKKKEYQANEFSAEHISDVLAMNKALAIKVIR